MYSNNRVPINQWPMNSLSLYFIKLSCFEVDLRPQVMSCVRFEVKSLSSLQDMFQDVCQVLNGDHFYKL